MSCISFPLTLIQECFCVITFLSDQIWVPVAIKQVKKLGPETYLETRISCRLWVGIFGGFLLLIDCICHYKNDPASSVFFNLRVIY